MIQEEFLSISDLDRFRSLEGLRGKHKVEDVRPDSTYFLLLYEFLNNYFGPRDEFEPLETTRLRFLNNTKKPEPSEISTKYYMRAILENGEIVAGRTHQIILPPENSPKDTPIVVFLMNSLVAPQHRKKGYAQLLRSYLPLVDVYECTRDTPFNSRNIIFVAEMEMLEVNDRDSVNRLKSYSHAGFRKLPDGCVNYFQPYSIGEKPITMNIVCRTVGNDSPAILTPLEIQHIVKALVFSYEEAGYEYSEKPSIYINPQSNVMTVDLI